MTFAPWERGLLLHLLDDYDQVLSSRGCNDFDLDSFDLTAGERDQLLGAVSEMRADGTDADYVLDYEVLAYLVDRLKDAALREPDAPACPSCGHQMSEHDAEGCNHEYPPRRYANGNHVGERGFCVCQQTHEATPGVEKRGLFERQLDDPEFRRGVEEERRKMAVEGYVCDEPCGDPRCPHRPKGEPDGGKGEKR